MSKTASLEIHQINVGQGDSTLVVVRDTVKLKARVVEKGGQSVADSMEAIDYLPYCIQQNISLAGTVTKSLLIDAGNDCYGYAVQEYCERVGALDPDLANRTTRKISQDNFLMMVTHYHDDHHDGLRCVMRGPNFTNGKPDEVYRPAAFIRLAEFTQRDRRGIGTTGIIMAEIEKQVVAMTGDDRRKKTEVWRVPRGGKNENSSGGPATQWGFTLGNGVGNIPIIIKAVASERFVFTGAYSKVQEVAPKSRKGAKKGTIDENDRSIALVVEYGSFRHFLAGDAGGSEGKTYSDIEGVLAPRMESEWVMPIVKDANKGKFASAGHCCSFKLNHHGTKYSNDEQFLATLRPRLIVVPAGVKLYFHGHPTIETVNRLSAAAWQKQEGTRVDNSIATKVNNSTGAIVATEVASKGKQGKPFNPDTGNKIKVLGDIVIRPIDEDIDKAQRASSTGQAIRIQVYGNRDQTPLLKGSVYALRPPVDAAASGGNYPTNPIEVICGLH